MFRRILKTWPGDLRTQDDLITSLSSHSEGERKQGHIESAKTICEEALQLAAEAFRSRRNPHPVWAIDDLRKEAPCCISRTRRSPSKKPTMPDRPTNPPPAITALLARVRLGQPEALDDLLPLVYRELHRLAQSALFQERPGHTLQPTALVHEAYLRLFEGQTPAFADRAHFLGVASRLMRQILVDHARTRRAQKRGAHLQVPLLDDSAATPPHGDLLELDEAMEKLGREDQRLVTLIEMRYFAGMTAEETAEARSESVHAIRHDLRYAQARLRRFLV